jgi:tetratricopeptide (TPR) repeat protein
VTPGSAPAGPVPRESVPLSPEAYLKRGLDLLERPLPEDQVEAQRLLIVALRSDPDLSAAHAGLARSALYVHAVGIDPSPARLTEALSESRRAAEADAKSPANAATYALALAASDHLTEARAEAVRAAGLGGEGPEADLALCIIDRLRRSLDDAVAAGRRAAGRAPDSLRVIVGLAEALREAGQYDAALELFGQAADLDHESALPQLGAAATLAKAGSFGKASRAYEIILDKYKYATTRALEGAAAMRISMRDWEGAVDLYDRVELPAEDGSLPTLLSLYGKGYALLRLDRAAEAEYFLSLLIERVPADYDGPARGREVLFRAYNDLVNYFEEHGRPDRALALLRQAIARPGAPLGLARALATRLGDAGSTREAAEILERAIPGAPAGEESLEIAESALALARLRSAGGRRSIPGRSAAGEALRAASRRIPAEASGPAHYRMARAWGLAGEPDLCLAALEQARARGYLPQQAETEADLASVRARPRFRALFADAPATP